MRNLSVQAYLSLILTGTVNSLMASGPVLGLVVASGSVQVDHSRIWSNATVFDGSTVETGRAVSRLRLQNGTQVRLASGSRAQVYQSRLVLQQGTGRIESSTAYPIEVSTLRFTPASPGTVADLSLAGKQVDVAVAKGSMKVTNASGVLIANLTAGRAVSLTPQEGAAAATQVTGCLLQKDGKYVIFDQTTNTVIELTGADASELGNHVTVIGIPSGEKGSVAGASQVVKIAKLTRAATGGCADAAKQIGASAGKAAAGAAGSAGAAGASAGGIGATTIAIIGGVAVAGTIGGLAAAGAFSGENKPSASR